MINIIKLAARYFFKKIRTNQNELKPSYELKIANQMIGTAGGDSSGNSKRFSMG